VARGVGDKVGEALEGDHVAVVHQLVDGLAEREDVGH
jgi:hypothetical protein